MIEDLIKSRRSIRIFTGEKIAYSKIEKIIEAGIWAPTGCNNQEIKFLVIGKEPQLSNVLRFKPFFRGVSHFVLVFYDMNSKMSKQLYKKGTSSERLAVIDSGLAIQNMVLQAKELGIDSCIVNLTEMHYRKEKNLTFWEKISKELKKKLGIHSSNPQSLSYFLYKELGLEKDYKIVAGIALGIAKKFPNLEKARHGKNLIKRDEPENYLITNKFVETE